MIERSVLTFLQATSPTLRLALTRLAGLVALLWIIGETGLVTRASAQDHPNSPTEAASRLLDEMAKPIRIQVWLNRTWTAARDSEAYGASSIKESGDHPSEHFLLPPILVGWLTVERAGLWTWTSTGAAPASNAYLQQELLLPLLEMGRVPETMWWTPVGWKPLGDAAGRPWHRHFPIYAAYTMALMGYAPIVDGMSLDRIDHALTLGCFRRHDPTPPACQAIDPHSPLPRWRSRLSGLREVAFRRGRTTRARYRPRLESTPEA